MRETKGWYSGKYDSTKQKQTITETDIETGFLKYRTSIRFEMLLAGSIVITDSQWYDGVIFSYMTEKGNGEFEAFMNFISDGFEKNSVPLVIRRRKNYMDMFKKPFLFSSIMNIKLQRFILNIWNGYECEEDKKQAQEEKCHDLCSFLDFIEQELKDSHDDSSILDEFYRFRTGIEKLDAIDERLFIPWGEKAYIPEEMNAIKPQLLELIEKYKNSIFSSSYDIINTIEKALDASFPNRSKIKDSIKALADNLGNTELEEKFMHKFDNSYNYAIAKQHDCRYYDLYDAISNTKYDKNKEESLFLDTQYLPQEVLHYLGELTWPEFGELYYDDELISKRIKWLDDFDRQDVEITKKSFYDYLDCIMKKIKGLNTWIINDSVFYRTKGTKRFVNVIINELGKMIGGASSDYIIDSDEICLFFGSSFNDSEKDKIVRYASTDDETKLFDTVFAPIEKAINNKIEYKNEN